VPGAVVGFDLLGGASAATAEVAAEDGTGVVGTAVVGAVVTGVPAACVEVCAAVGSAVGSLAVEAVADNRTLGAVAGGNGSAVLRGFNDA